MLKKIKRSSDWLSYDLCFKELRFMTISIILIGVLVVGWNLKPLNPSPKANWYNQAPTSFRSKIFPLAFMGSFELI
jgi:uncharacterized alpha/beta hydrolase family protein